MKTMITSIASLVTLVALTITAAGCAASSVDSDEPLGAAEEALTCDPYPGVHCTDHSFDSGFDCTCSTRSSCAWLAAACAAVYDGRLEPIPGGGSQCSSSTGGGPNCPF